MTSCKNLVGAMLEGGGFEVIDLGVDVPPEKFAAAIEEKAPRAGYHGCPLRSPLLRGPPR